MQILLIFMVVLSLVVAVVMSWISFKMLRDTQKKAKIQHEEKLRQRSTKQSSIDK